VAGPEPQDDQRPEQAPSYRVPDDWPGFP
jgi:hypothetical protein